MEKFNLEHQYKLYLKRSGLKEEDMPVSQRVETKRAFMGGCSQMVMLFTDDIAELEETEALKIFSDIINQCANFWMKESGMSN